MLSKPLRSSVETRSVKSMKAQLERERAAHHETVLEQRRAFQATIDRLTRDNTLLSHDLYLSGEAARLEIDTLLAVYHETKAHRDALLKEKDNDKRPGKTCGICLCRKKSKVYSQNSFSYLFGIVPCYHSTHYSEGNEELHVLPVQQLRQLPSASQGDFYRLPG